MALSYFSFDKVMSELGIEEDELKRLVSEGQIRAYRDEDKMKFRKDDIEQLRSSIEPAGSAEPTIILPQGSLDDGDEELDSDGEKGVPPEQIGAGALLFWPTRATPPTLPPEHRHHREKVLGSRRRSH
jgi:hypothetical protein